MTKYGLLNAYSRIESAVSGPIPFIASNCSRVGSELVFVKNLAAKINRSAFWL